MSSSFDRFIGDLQLVEILVAALDAAQDFDRIFDGRLIDHHRLEATLKGCIALDILAELVKRCRADGLEFAACQGWLEDVGRIQRAFCTTRADQRMELVDEQDTACFFDLVDHTLESFFELAAILCTGDQRAHVKRHNALAFDRIGYIARDNALGQTFGDRGFTDAGFTDQGRIILGAAGQNLNDSLDFLVASDDRIELAGFGPVGQIGR